MKHRSTVIFIIIVAALAVAPQVAEQVDQIASHAASRVEGAIWNTFLSVNAQRYKGDADTDARMLVASGGPQARSTTNARRRATGNGAQLSRANEASAARGALRQTSAPVEDGALPFLAKNEFKPFVLDLKGDINPHVSVKSLPRVHLKLPAPDMKALSMRLQMTTDQKELLRIVARLKDEALRKVAADEWEMESREERIAPPSPARAVRVRAQAKGTCPTAAPEAVQMPAPPATHTGAMGISDSF
ncbi:MAG TPA: hypothetical protein VNA19_13735 [Pyrinomonadaceae bacterium]|jgi:hypothetical protein|nr:hypothetical protein [Pyrinomonadaceae bacterium]